MSRLLSRIERLEAQFVGGEESFVREGFELTPEEQRAFDEASWDEFREKFLRDREPDPEFSAMDPREKFSVVRRKLEEMAKQDNDPVLQAQHTAERTARRAEFIRGYRASLKSRVQAVMAQPPFI